MRRIFLLVTALTLLGCGDDKSKNPPPQGGVEVNVPGVKVKVGDKGTEVTAPGVEVKTKKDG